jgi:hypothetical protein
MHTTFTSLAMCAALAASQQPPSKPPRQLPQLSPEQEYFHHMMDELVGLNKRRRELFPVRMPAPHAYAMYHATVQGGIGRQCGKSEYILRRAQPDDLIIVPCEVQLKHQFRDAPCRVITAGELHRRYTSRNRMPPEVRYSRIWVDEPYAVFDQIDRHELYFQLARDTEQTFILLGP